jgi:hypothetical protein
MGRISRNRVPAGCSISSVVSDSIARRCEGIIAGVVPGTEQAAVKAILRGGIGQDFFIIACRYQDIAAGGPTARFFARSGIRMGDGEAYNDYVPDSGVVSTSSQMPFGNLGLIGIAAIIGVIGVVLVVVVVVVVVFRTRRRHLN